MKKLLLLALAAILLQSVQAQEEQSRSLNDITRMMSDTSVSDDEVTEAVKEAVETMDKKNKVCDEKSSYTKRLRRLTTGMTYANGIPLNFKVYDCKDYNALSFPDGSVRVFSLLMDILTDEELLGVLGHEIGHVALRHTKKMWRNEMLHRITTKGKSSSRNRSGYYMDDISYAVFSAGFSRKNEIEADDYGYDFLKRCGKNPMSMAISFMKLQILTGDHSKRQSTLLKTFSSHPDFNERIERVYQRAVNDGYVE